VTPQYPPNGSGSMVETYKGMEKELPSGFYRWFLTGATRNKFGGGKRRVDHSQAKKRKRGRLNICRKTHSSEEGNKEEE